MSKVKFSDLINIQTRVKENEKVAKSYAKLMLDGVDFPSITVFVDEVGHMFLADGYHRVLAYKIACNVDEIDDSKIDFKKGTKSDAIKFNIENNAKKGLAMTSQDKRNAITILLRDDEMSKLSDRAIAQMVGTDHKTVGKYRKMILDGIDPMYQKKKKDKDNKGEDTDSNNPTQEEILQQLVATLQKENSELKDKNRILSNKSKKMSDSLASCTIQGKLNRNVITKLIHPDRFTQALKDYPELLADLGTALGAINSVK